MSTENENLHQKKKLNKLQKKEEGNETKPIVEQFPSELQQTLKIHAPTQRLKKNGNIRNR